MATRRHKVEPIRIPFNEWDYPEGLRKKRVVLRTEMKEQRRRAKNAKWYVRETANDPPGTLSHPDWVENHRECVIRAWGWRDRLRATNLYY